MKAPAPRLSPLALAAVACLLLLVAAVALGLSEVAASRAATSAAPAELSGQRGEDPPPLTPVLDPAPREPRPAELFAQAAEPADPYRLPPPFLSGHGGAACSEAGCPAEPSQGL